MHVGDTVRLVKISNELPSDVVIELMACIGRPLIVTDVVDELVTVDISDALGQRPFTNFVSLKEECVERVCPTCKGSGWVVRNLNTWELESSINFDHCLGSDDLPNAGECPICRPKLCLKSNNTGKAVKIGDHLFVGLHDRLHLTEYEVLQIDPARCSIWIAVVMSPVANPIGFRDWLWATELDCEWKNA